MEFIPTRVHAVLDYAIGALLIVAPWLLGFATGGPAQWTPVLLGIGVILYSLVTAYEYGIAPLISVPVHLGLDVAVGAILALSPWLFGFSELVVVPHLVVGLVQVGTGMFTERRPRAVPARSPGSPPGP